MRRWPGYHREVISPPRRPDGGQGRHPYRTWLHLLPLERQQALAPGAELVASRILIDAGMALAAPEGGLRPGPEFARVLGGRPGSLPMALPGRGEVRVEAGSWRCYPDPGPEGFDTEPPRGYRASCPHCAGEVELFRLGFPFPDPLTAACPRCAGALPLLELEFVPDLPAARLEITFGDLERRPSLAGHPVWAELESALGFPLREVHVTL